MQPRQKARSRRGSIVVLSAFLMVIMLGMVAFAIDLGVMMVTRTQLQAAADSAAMAAGAVLGVPGQNSVTTAQTFAAHHKAGGANVSLASSDIENGTWDSGSRTFTPSQSISNAVRVTVRANGSSGGNKLFFGGIFGRRTQDLSAQAIAMGNPRDICFVVDLSGSMNDDTSTGYGSSASYNASGYTSTYNTMMQQVYTDFGFGTFPGTTQTIGLQLGSPSWSSLTGTSSKLTASSFTYNSKSYTIPTAYRITSSDNTAAKRETKVYKWIIDYQLAGTFACVGNAKPVPNSSNTASYNYWKAYIDDIRDNSGVLGYRSYVTWLMEYGGRDQTMGDSGAYGQLSTLSANCPYHTETVNGTNFSFPPCEQPTHSERRSVIAGLQQVKSKNQLISDTYQRDYVSIVTFDKQASTVVRLGLTHNYDTAMTSATTMQAVGNNGVSTATETGLIAAYNLIKPASEGGTGRENTSKIVILLTDGAANLKTSSNSVISTYRTNNPSTNFYGGSSDYNSDAALMQASTMRGDHWYVYALALGLGADYDFMDRMARMGGTDDDEGMAPRTSGDPSAYEAELTAILSNVISTPQVRLVK